VFLVFTLLLILFITFVGAALVTSTAVLVDRAPELVTNGLDEAGKWLNSAAAWLGEDTITKIRESLAGAGPAIGKFIQSFVAGSLAVIPATFPTVMGFLTLPIFLIFALINYERYGRYFRDIFPEGIARHGTRIFTSFGTHMGKYIRMMIIVSAIAGFLMFIGMAVLGVSFPGALGAVTALLQLIPIIGPLISAAVVLVVVLALKPGVILWALGVIILVQLIVMLVQGPIQEKHFPLDPAVTMVLLTVGGFIGSYLGTILALPVGATAWDLYKYFRDEAERARLKE
jgi:predicted PurR-regulated permease PerM